MSVDLAFVTVLILRMAITAAFVITAAIITERSGPVIGALVATLPISAGPSYVFLALDHDAAFIAQGALASLPINAVTMFFGLTYIHLARHHNVVVSLGTAMLVWLALAVLVRQIEWTLASGLLANAVAFAICLPLMARFRHARMPLLTRRWYDILLRAALVSTLVGAVVTLSATIGPTGSGILAVFPIVFSSLLLILHPRIGGMPTAAVMANGGWGLMGFGLALATVPLTAPRFGSPIALSLALATCVVWNLGLWMWGRRKVRMV